MEVFGIAFSKGSLGKNLGCEKMPAAVSKNIKMIPCFQDNIEQTNSSIFDSLKNVKKALIIGGDHSITYSCFNAFAFNNLNSGIIVFDAHPDLQSNFKPPTHEDYLRVLIEEGKLDASRIVLIGLRAISKEEQDYLNLKKIVYFDIRKIIELGVEDVCTLIMERAIEWNALYLSIDIDVCDPGFAPGTGYIEPGGISSADLLYFISRIKRMKNLKFIDIVEGNPDKDINKLTTSLIVRLAKEFNNEIVYSN